MRGDSRQGVCLKTSIPANNRPPKPGGGNIRYKQGAGERLFVLGMRICNQASKEVSRLNRWGPACKAQFRVVISRLLAIFLDLVVSFLSKNEVLCAYVCKGF